MTNSVLTSHVQHLIQSLAAQGVQDFVVSPGSRSTPIALLLAEYKRHVNTEVQVHIAVDERDAAFFALGLAKTSQNPVVLLATSGTATSNYLPAVSEAKLSHVPLILLTTDRPQELQGIGAPQTLPQLGMYGENVKDAISLTLQDSHADVADYIDYKVQHLVRESTIQPVGPIQINLPLRKPLMPDLGSEWPEVNKQTFITPKQQFDLASLKTKLAGKRVMIFAGPAETKWHAAAFQTVAEKWQIPVVADVLSGVRGQANMIVGIDSLIAAEAIPEEYIPEVVIRFGGTPVSGRLLPWLAEKNILEIQVGTQHVGHDHGRHASVEILGDDMQVLRALRDLELENHPAYLEAWLAADAKINQTKLSNTLSEMSIAEQLDKLPVDSQLFLANSMVVRDFDNYWKPDFVIKTMGNRGANGIDGTIASATGMAMNGQATWLPIGDLTLFHDMNGLMLAKQNKVDLTVVVTNNNGGGIFSFLPQSSADEYFEDMFGTPLNLDIKKIAALYDAKYVEITEPNQLGDLVKVDWHGLRIIEVKTTRSENLTAHEERIAALREATHG